VTIVTSAHHQQSDRVLSRSSGGLGLASLLGCLRRGFPFHFDSCDALNSPLRFGFLLIGPPGLIIFEHKEQEDSLECGFITTAFWHRCRAQGLSKPCLLFLLTLPPMKFTVSPGLLRPSFPASDALPLAKLEEGSRSEPEDRQGDAADRRLRLGPAFGFLRKRSRVQRCTTRA